MTWNSVGLKQHFCMTSAIITASLEFSEYWQHKTAQILVINYISCLFLPEKDFILLKFWRVFSLGCRILSLFFLKHFLRCCSSALELCSDEKSTAILIIPWRKCVFYVSARFVPPLFNFMYFIVVEKYEILTVYNTVFFSMSTADL